MRRLALLLVLLALAPLALAQSPVQTSTQAQDLAAIRHLMEQQTADWNHGDLDRFATGYKNSPDILFVGSTVNRGYAAMLARYHKAYPTPAAMGQLTFTHFEPVLLDAHFATATGNFHLARAPKDGGDAKGIFSLVFEKTPAGWRIIRDHTTAFPNH